MNEAVSFESLSRNAMQLSAQVIVNTADLAILLWPDGQIAEVTLGKHTGLEIDADFLRHRHIAEIVRPEDAAKITDLVSKAKDGQRPASVELRHSKLIQDGTTARYSAHIAGDGKNVMLIGSGLSAELSLSAKAAWAEIAMHERKERKITEDRYRLLFESSSEGLLIVNRATGLIEQTNRIASILVGQSADGLVGTSLWSHFADDDEELPPIGDNGSDLLELTARVLVSGDQVRVNAHTVRSFLGTMLIVRLNKLARTSTADNNDHDTNAIELLRQTTVPLFLADGTRAICWCNGAFAALVGGAKILGEPVADVLGISPHALDLVLRQADMYGRMPTSLSSLDSRLAIAEEAHLTIVSVESDVAANYGFLVHMLGEHEADSQSFARPETSALAELVGKAPLKTLVRKSTGAIERSCIEMALRLTGNNRAAAAMVLGLSRQSLYLKMREHDLR